MLIERLILTMAILSILGVLACKLTSDSAPEWVLVVETYVTLVCMSALVVLIFVRIWT